MADPWASLFAAAAGQDTEDEPVQAPDHDIQAGGDSDRRAGALAAFRAFAADHRAAAKHMRQHDLANKLQLGRRGSGHGPLLRIENFLPADVAEGALEVMKHVDPAEWVGQSAGADARQHEGEESYGAGSTRHKYSSAAGDDGSDLAALTRLISCALPDRPANLRRFQAGAYGKGGFIEPHDDAAYASAEVEVGPTDAEGVRTGNKPTRRKEVLCSREVALIFYLTPGWEEHMGGCLLDHATGNVLVPRFNTAVLFEVPRLHEVSRMHTSRLRFSIFGWYLVPGRKYALSQLDVPSKSSKARATSSASSAAEAHQQGQKHGLRDTAPALDSPCSRDGTTCHSSVGEKRSADGLGDRKNKNRTKRKKNKKKKKR